MPNEITPPEIAENLREEFEILARYANKYCILARQLILRTSAAEAQVRELQANMNWREITTESLPKIGEEVWRDLGDEFGGIDVEAVDSDQELWGLEDWKLEYWTHHRLITFNAQEVQMAKQSTICAICLIDKETPLRLEEGYVCLTCIDHEIGHLRKQNRKLQATVERLSAPYDPKEWNDAAMSLHAKGHTYHVANRMQQDRLERKP